MPLNNVGPQMDWYTQDTVLPLNIYKYLKGMTFLKKPIWLRENRKAVQLHEIHSVAFKYLQLFTKYDFLKNLSYDSEQKGCTTPRYLK